MANTTASSEHELSKFHRLLREQVGHELTASHQYVAIAAWYDHNDMPQVAGFFYRQALEERDHAMMIVRFLLDVGIPAHIPTPAAVHNEFDTAREPAALALRQEREVTAQIYRLVDAAREERDYQGEQFLQWFLAEQTEEVATMSTLVSAADRAGNNMFDLENFVARDLAPDDGGTRTAPPTAGPAVS